VDKVTVPQVTFRALHRAAVEQGFKVRLYIFEGGETVEIADGKSGAQIVRTTYEYGDDKSASVQAAERMIEMHLLSAKDFEG